MADSQVPIAETAARDDPRITAPHRSSRVRLKLLKLTKVNVLIEGNGPVAVLL